MVFLLGFVFAIVRSMERGGGGSLCKLPRIPKVTRFLYTRDPDLECSEPLKYAQNKHTAKCPAS